MGSTLPSKQLTKTQSYPSSSIDKTKESTASALTKALKIANKSIPVHTLTLDNGTEFALYKSVEQSLGIKVYFADNHSPWQRGANENINGLIRFFFPRGTNFNNVSDEYLQYVIELINNRPRKCLGLLSPVEFIDSCVALGLTIHLLSRFGEGD